MKLFQLQEARYAHGKYVEWVIDNWSADNAWPTVDVEITEEQLQQAKKQLSQIFGQHKRAGTEYWYWLVDMNGKARNVVLYRSDDGEHCQLSLSANTGSI